MVPLLVDKFEEIVRFYCLRFSFSMEKENRTLKLIKLVIFLWKYLWPDVEVGYVIAEELRKLKSKDKIKEDFIYKFKQGCRSFLATLSKHMVEKSTLQSSFASCTKAMNAVYMSEKWESCKALFFQFPNIVMSFYLSL